MEDSPVKNKSRMSFVVKLLLALAVIFLILNWQSIYRNFAPPKPIIVSKGGDDASSKLFDYSARV